MNTVMLVARREFRTRLRAKATLISTIIMVVFIVGGLVAIALVRDHNSGGPTMSLGVAAETAELVPELKAQAAAGGVTLTVTDLDAAAGKAQVLDGDLDAYLSGTPSSPTMGFEKNPDPAIASLVTDAARAYVLADAVTGLGGDPAQVQAALAAVQPMPVALGEATTLDPARIVTAFVTTGLLLFALMQACTMIATGVVEEKASRVVEILLATIKPGQLLAGKVLGMGALALLQVLVLGTAGVVAAQATGLLEGFQLNIGGAIASLIMWFVLGFAIYATVFGGFASLVSRQEDIGAVTTPLIFLIMIPFYLGVYLVPNQPDGTITKVLSQIPFFAPFMMPIRQAFGQVSTGEVLLSIALCLAVVPVMIWLGGRVYSRAVLNTGGRMKLKDALGR